MLALFETPGGSALFKILKEGKLQNAEELWKEFETPDSARKMEWLKAFDKFVTTADALGAVNHIVDGKLPKGLRKFLKAECQGKTLVIADSKLGKAISEKLETSCLNNAAASEVMSWLRSQLSELIVGLRGSDIAPMSLGLSHSLSRYKLKFSPDKVDTMIVQAIGFLMTWQIISMGTEVSNEDMLNIKALCDQVITLSEYHAQLYEYLWSGMNAIAPNLTIVVGELVGARLIAHAGSLVTLAKYPASTVQILGAEKAPFRALKTKQPTLKYGIIYHASLVGQAPPKFKGKIARALAPKSALSIRSGALGEYPEPIVGIEGQAKVEARLRQLEGRELGKSSGAAHGKANIELFDKDWKKENPAEVGYTVKEKNKKDKTSEAEPEVTTSIAMTVDGVKAEEKLKKKKTSASVAAEDVATADASPELKASIKKRKAEPVVEVPVDAPVDAVKTKKKRKSKAEA
ncbi:unnamed protein product [Sphagnum compactum]